MIIAFGVFLWLVCAFVGHGLSFAYVQEEFKLANCYRENMGMSIIVGLLAGPLYMVISVFITGFGKHGFKVY